MEAAVIDKVAALAAPTFSTINGLEYSSKPLHLLTPPSVSSLKVNTLQGLADALTSGLESADSSRQLVHVLDHASVAVLDRQSNEYAVRRTLIAASVLGGDRAFTFNQFLSQEEAIIGLQSCFTAEGDRDTVLRTISNLASQNSLQVEDNGVSQSATAKSGVALVSQIDIKPRVVLAPYRTFREVEQPKSEFVLRIKKGQDGLPKVGLFEADGGAWKMDAIHNVRDWLKGVLFGWTIIA